MDPPRKQAYGKVRVALHHAWRRAGREFPKIRRKLAPWWGSLTFHAIVLACLLLIVLSGSEREGMRPGSPDATLIGQLIEDATSVIEQEKAGDVFNRLDSKIISAPLDPTELDPELLNVPDLPETIRFAPDISRGAELDSGELRIETRNPLQQALGSAPGFVAAAGRTSPFSGRHAAVKAALLRREGGTKESEAAVERGLDWLARHQAPDGRWLLDCNPFCDRVPCPSSPAMQSDVAATGLALLPLLGAGHSHSEQGRYQSTLARGIAWLLSIQAPTGEFYTGGESNSRMYSHAIGAMAICEAYGVSNDARLLLPAQKAIAFIASAQSMLDGGWRYEPGSPGDTSVFGWQMMCLRSAHLAGIKVPLDTVRAATNYLNAAACDPAGSTYAYMPGRSVSPTMTAEALLCRQYLGAKRQAPPMVHGAGLVFEDLMNSQEVNIYYWYYATQMLHNMGGPNWPKWNDRVRDYLVGSQTPGPGCDRGSWDPGGPQPDRWGRAAGRHYQTCMSLMTLEVYYRYLPLYRDQEKEPLRETPQPFENDPDQLMEEDK